MVAQFHLSGSIPRDLSAVDRSQGSVRSRAIQIDAPILLDLEGSVQLFTSPCRNFFTDVMAEALRYAGQGNPVLVVQFLKGGVGQGPLRPMQLGQYLDWIRCDYAGVLGSDLRDPDAATLEASALAVGQLWEHSRSMVLQGRYDRVVFDEISLAVNLGWIEAAAVLELLADRPRHVDVLMTGPDMPEALRQAADQITELRRR
jgi:cob(I)alamin adenosyltransferase